MAQEPAPAPRSLQRAIAAAATAASGSTALAQGSAAQGSSDPVLGFFKGTELSGFVDFYYGYNFNGVDPALRNFDVTHNSFSLNLAEVALEKKPTADSRGGFRIDLDYGPTARIVHSFEPAGSAVSDTFQNIEQAYLSYLAPAGSGLQLDFGKFVTPAGYEVIESKDNWNYSRSLLFALAIPYYHMGLRASYSPSDKVSVAGYLVNGWNNSVDNNSGKTFIGSLTLKPSSKFTFIENYIGGPEAPPDTDGSRNLSDTNLTFTASDKLAVGANFDFGHEGASDQSWSGIAAYVHFNPRPWAAITPRYEYLDDNDGFMSGTSQKLQEFTITFEGKHKDGVIFRFEYRHDFSDEEFFAKDDGDFSKGQDTVTFGLIYAFSTKTP